MSASESVEELGEGVPIVPAESALIPVLVDFLESLSERPYAAIEEMLNTGQRRVETPELADGRFLYLSAQAIQRLDPAYGGAIEVSVSAQSDNAHIGAYLYFRPREPVEWVDRILRRPLDATITYNVCEVAPMPPRRVRGTGDRT